MPVLPAGSDVPDPWLPQTTHQEVAAGFDSKLADGNALIWESASWPNLAGATLAMVVGHEQYNLYGNLPVSWPGSVPAEPASPSSIHIDVPAALTATLPQDEYDYQLEATLPSGDVIVVAVGKLTVRATPGTVPLFPPVL
jgi:hypothetical protein